MERKFLEELGLDKERIDKILDQHSAEIGRLKQASDTLATERDDLKKQLDAVSEEIKSYQDLDVDGIQRAAADWEEKYNTDTQTLREQLAAEQYGFAVKDALSACKFPSESAKKAFVAELNAQKLPLQDGKLLGLEDFKKEYQQSDPGTFVKEGDQRTPVFTRGTGGSPTGAASSPFGFNFTGVRKKQD